VGAQLHWLLQTQTGLEARLAHVLTYPQYWGYRLTGEMATDVTSLGCHTDLWNPWEKRFSGLVDRLGLAGRIAPARRSAEVIGRLRPDLALQTGLPADTPVTVGIHDSNASLYPYVLGRDVPFAVVSTGTWVVAMAVGGDSVALDPARDVLVNVNALGDAVPSARFMGGREFELIRAGSEAKPTEADRAAVLAEGAMILPAVEPASGPFPGRKMRWMAEPQSAGPRMVALSWYLALMTDTCLRLIGARGATIIEGPFARNPDYLAMLAVLRPEGVEIAASATGTSAGAALLCLDRPAAVPTTAIAQPLEAGALRAYADRWQGLL
jgi:sugar (pentulose or hexulose) kinase